MTEILIQNIKALIDRHSSIAGVLEAYHIACTTCNVGTCQLKDIVEIHNLSENDESALFAKIAEIVFPAQKVEIPRLPRKTAADTGKKSFSPPIQMLVDEHTHIKRVIAAIPGVQAALKEDFAGQHARIMKIIDFIRNYADRFHHAKEEDILFRQFDGSMDIIRVMLNDHETGRNHVRAVMDALGRNDAEAVSGNLAAYGALLTEHIRKEDEILYPWMDRSMSDTQVGKLYSSFLAAEAAFEGDPERQVAFAESLS